VLAGIIVDLVVVVSLLLAVLVDLVASTISGFVQLAVLIANITGGESVQESIETSWDTRKLTVGVGERTLLLDGIGSLLLVLAELIRGRVELSSLLLVALEVAVLQVLGGLVLELVFLVEILANLLGARLSVAIKTLECVLVLLQLAVADSLRSWCRWCVLVVALSRSGSAWLSSWLSGWGLSWSLGWSLWLTCKLNWCSNGCRAVGKDSQSSEFCEMHVEVCKE